MTQFSVTPEGIKERERQLQERMRAALPRQASAGVVQPMTSTPLELRIRLPDNPPTVPSDAPDALRNAVLLLDALRSHSEDIVAEGKRLSADRGLSMEGKRAAFKRFADERIAIAAKIADRVADGLKTEVAVLKDKLPKLRSVGQTSTHDTIREKELRDELRKLKPTERFQLYREAVADGDAILFYAVYNAHRVMALVDAEHLEQGKQDFLRNQKPAAFDRYETTVQMLDVLETSGAQFIGEVQEHVEALFRPKPKPIQTSPYPLPHGA